MTFIIDFDKLIEKHLKRERKQKEIGRYYPSEIGNCIRKIWYSYKYPMDVDPDRLKLFELGDLLHRFILEVLKSERNVDSIKFLDSETPLKMQQKDFLISGRLDDIVIAKDAGKKIIIEVKSVKDIRSTLKPNIIHVMQVQFYMHATGIYNGIILYVDKTNLKTKAFEVEYDEKHSLDILERFQILHELLVKDILPIDEAKKSNETNWMCNMCEYKVKCDKNEK